jgi:endonuclease G
MSPKLMPIHVICRICAVIIGGAILLSGCQTVSDRLRINENDQPRSNENETTGISSVHLRLGNPSNASTADPNNYLLIGKAYAASYNNSKGTPNWVAWKTTSGDLGERLERVEFHPDPRLPPGIRRITAHDYSGSGYDRGHLCPSADRFADPEANFETFAMTNVVPQTPDLNQFVWNKLEMYSRGLARHGVDVYTIAGVYGDAGRINGKLTVPTNCWKVILWLREGQDPAGQNSGFRVVAVDVPNIQGIRNDSWRKYRTTMRELEEKTGYRFFSSLPTGSRDQ